MVKVISDTKIYYNGSNSLLLEGTMYDDNADIVKAKPELFTKVESKLEILTEEPVAEAVIETVEEPVVEPVVEERPKKRNKKS